MNHPCRFAIIGAGGVAQSYAAAFETCNEACVVAVVDVRREAAQALAERLNCDAYIDVESLFRHGPDLDAAVICTPPNTHEELAIALVTKRIPVLCEKPFAIDSASANRMINAAQRHKTLLTMASKFRYVEDVIRAKSLIAGGAVGEPLQVDNIFTARVDMSRRWNSDPLVSGGGVLIDNGTHAVDLMRYLLGLIVEVQAIEGKRVQGLAVEDSARLFARTADGVLASSDLSWSLSKECENYLNYYGTHGCLTIGWRESKYRLHSNKEWTAFGKGYDKIQAFRDQIINFARAVCGAEPLRITASDALASVEVIEAAYDSLRSNRWVSVRSSSLSSGPHSSHGDYREQCSDRRGLVNLGQCSHTARSFDWT